MNIEGYNDRISIRQKTNSSICEVLLDCKLSIGEFLDTPDGAWVQRAIMYKPYNKTSCYSYLEIENDKIFSTIANLIDFLVGIYEERSGKSIINEL